VGRCRVHHQLPSSKVIEIRRTPVLAGCQAQNSEGKGHTFESCRVRHFGTELGTPKPAVFALEAATSVRSNSLFDPMMRSSSTSTSTRWANARR
jgi:hypothetical protein